MKRTWWIVGLAALVAAAVWYVGFRSEAPGNVVVDLVEAFRVAEKRTPGDPAAVFSMEPQAIKGETKPAVYAHPPARVIYKDIVVPPGARLELFLGVKEEAWDKSTDGVYFRVGVSHGETYTELAARTVSPALVPADRRWIPLSFDLSAYAGHKINVIFNTHASPPGVNENSMYDFAVFGAPRIVATGGGAS